MANRISSLFTSQVNRLVPYLTPRAGLISLLALGALSLFVYFLRRNPDLPRVTPPPSPRPEEKSKEGEQVPQILQASVNPATASPDPEVPPQVLAQPAQPPSPIPLPEIDPPVALNPDPMPKEPPANPPRPAQPDQPSIAVAPSILQPAPAPSPSSPLPEDPDFKNNVQAIIDFPLEKTAQIKSFSEKLARADGYFRPLNSQVGTKLPETLAVITKTFLIAFQQFEQEVQAVESKATANEKIPLLRSLSDLLTQEMNLLEGLGNIHEIYQQRYQDKAGKEGLENLKSLYETRKAAIKTHVERYQSLIQSLQESMRDSETPAALTASVLAPQPRSAATTEEAAKSLSAYCQLYCPGIASDQAQIMIREGQRLLGEILKGSCSPSHDMEESQKQLAYITWFLTYCALQKNQGAHEWAFSIEENSKLYRFLINSPESYQRGSSHYVGRSPPNNGYSSYVMKSSLHHGVDVHNDLMPAHKRTILYEMVDTLSSGKILFFKPENFGTRTYWDLGMHASELGESLQKKSRAQGEDDLPGMQKERVPDAAKKAFADLLTHIEENKASYQPLLSSFPDKYDSKKAIEGGKLWGISYMYAFVKRIKGAENCPAGFAAAAAPLEATWASLDHPDKRTGREIYLSADELKMFVERPLRL